MESHNYIYKKIEKKTNYFCMQYEMNQSGTSYLLTTLIW